MNPASLSPALFPGKFRALFQPARYKIFYGGRGGAKSWQFARALLILGARKQLRILCARETQKSIADSVHKLLEDQIALLGLGSLYTVEKGRILGTNGTEFTFAGLKHNIDNIKSLESYDVVWVEEAHTVSKRSWEKLIPTIRKEGSEIWISFNPELESDDTYQRFILHAPGQAVVVKVDYTDNPFCPQVLIHEAEELKAKDPDAYSHVYGGNCVNLMAGSIFANELRLAEKEKRITTVPYDRTAPVDCFWDLGYWDLCSIWFVQAVAFQYRFIDYLEGSQQTIQYYLGEMQKRGYVYGLDWIPWDVGLHAKQMGSGRSVEELMRQAGRKVRILPKLLKADQINAARTIFPQCWFDQAKCPDGLQALRHYRYGVDEQTGHPSKEPLHDWASHAGSAFQYACVGVKQPRQEAPPRPPRPKVSLSPWS